MMSIRYFVFQNCLCIYDFFPFFEECLQVMSVYLIAMGERGLLPVQ